MSGVVCMIVNYLRMVSDCLTVQTRNAKYRARQSRPKLISRQSTTRNIRTRGCGSMVMLERTKEPTLIGLFLAGLASRIDSQAVMV